MLKSVCAKPKHLDFMVCIVDPYCCSQCQDCIFLKEPGFTQTNWHSDLRMAPFDTNALVTVWIPMRPIEAEEDSGLLFAEGSHRDFALPFW